MRIVFSNLLQKTLSLSCYGINIWLCIFHHDCNLHMQEYNAYQNVYYYTTLLSTIRKPHLIGLTYQ